jgi:energy-coupling factor transport system permease protein
MLATWRYRPRDTFIQKLDPRTRLIFLFSVIFGLTIPEIWDYRIILPLLVLSLTLYFIARIEWKDVKRAWIFILVLVVFIVGLNGLLSGRGGPSSVVQVESPTVFEIPFYIPGTEWGFRVPITVNKLWFAVVQMTRMLTMAVLAIPIPYTMDPNIYGTAFRRMGASENSRSRWTWRSDFCQPLRVFSPPRWTRNVHAGMRWKYSKVALSPSCDGWHR